MSIGIVVFLRVVPKGMWGSSWDSNRSSIDGCLFRLTYSPVKDVEFSPVPQSVYVLGSHYPGSRWPLVASPRVNNAIHRYLLMPLAGISNFRSPLLFFYLITRRLNKVVISAF